MRTWTALPSAFMRYRCESVEIVKTMLLPSGDHAGCLPVPMSTPPEPFGFMVRIRLSRAKRIFVPVGRPGRFGTVVSQLRQVRSINIDPGDPARHLENDRRTVRGPVRVSLAARVREYPGQPRSIDVHRRELSAISLDEHQPGAVRRKGRVRRCVSWRGASADRFRPAG